MYSKELKEFCCSLWPWTPSTCRRDIMKAPAGNTSPRHWFLDLSMDQNLKTPSVHTKLAEICGCSSPNFMEEIMKSWSRPIFKAHWGNHILQHISYPLGPRQGCATHPAWWHNWGARYRGASPAKATVLDLDLDNGNNISWWWIKTMLDSFFGSVLFCETPNTIQN